MECMDVIFSNYIPKEILAVVRIFSFNYFKIRLHVILLHYNTKAVNL